MKRVKTGIVGCGAISPAYLQNLMGCFSSIIEVTACSDLIPDRSHGRAGEFGVPRVCSTEEILADPEIEIVVNLTNPWEHYAVSRDALLAGKNVFSEKPITVEMEEAEDLLDIARRKGLLVAGASDIFLGAGLQECRRLLDGGAIGVPLLASAFIALNYGSTPHRQRKGTGPVYDMGPYYLTALAVLAGPIRRVSGATSTPFQQKPWGANTPHAGEMFEVETPMEAVATLEFDSPLLAVFAASGEASEGYVPRLEFYGTNGTLQASDPNMYRRPVLIRGREGREVELHSGFMEEGRGLGVAELAWALRSGRQPRASGELMAHVLEVGHAIHRAADTGSRQLIHSAPARPEPFDLQAMFDAFHS